MLNFLGASRGCADFRDPTAAFRFKEGNERTCTANVSYSLYSSTKNINIGCGTRQEIFSRQEKRKGEHSRQVKKKK